MGVAEYMALLRTRKGHEALWLIRLAVVGDVTKCRTSNRITLDPLPTFGCVMLETSRIISGELCRNFIIWSKTRNINLVR